MLQRLPQLQDAAGIDRILARRAPMHVARRILIVLRNQSRERLHQRNGNIARQLRAASQRRDVEQFRFAFRRDGRRGRGGNYAGSRLRSRQRRLEIKHALQTRPIRKNLLDIFIAKQRIEQFHATL